jgi:methylenetetrahydrofolate reductase (NADPH)
MKVIEALKKKKTLSFEFFPPKTKEQEEKLFSVISELKKFSPDYVSVTYGALGAARERTLFWVKEIREKFGLEPVAHLTCVAANRDSILQQVEELGNIGVENILALRGDPPEGMARFVPPLDGFHFAKELVAFIKKHYPQFCLGAAGYPEGHPESRDVKADVLYLKEKVDSGADYIVTQLFFDNAYYFYFIKRCEKAGISVPIIAGIMPITNYKLLQKMTKICGAAVPRELLTKLEKHKDDPNSVREIGIEQAVKQCSELKEAGVPGLHFFVMNQSGPITEILKQL